MSRILNALGLGKNSADDSVRYPLLAGIAWSDSAKDVTRKLEALGCTMSGRDGDDLAFRGSLFGHQGNGWVYFSGEMASKVLFVLDPTDRDVLTEYDHLRRVLIEEFGKPPRSVDFVEEPFHRGDGRTLEAIAQNKGAIAVAWTAVPEDGNAGVVFRVCPDAKLRLSAESPGWGDEVKRRTANGTA